MDQQKCDNGGCEAKAEWTEIYANGPETPFVFCAEHKSERETWMMPDVTYERLETD